MAHLSTKTPTTDERIEQSQTIPHSDIAALAYQLWHDRGCPDGSPEEDWFLAEENLKTQRKSRPLSAHATLK